MNTSINHETHPCAFWKFCPWNSQIRKNIEIFLVALSSNQVNENKQTGENALEQEFYTIIVIYWIYLLYSFNVLPV